LNQKKKLSFIITRSDIGGAQFHTLSLIECFRHEYDVLLISGSEGVLTDRAESLGVRTKVIAGIDSLNFLSAITQLSKTLKVEKPDLVHVHSSLASFYGRFAARLQNINTLYTVHGWHFANEVNPIKRVLKIGVEFFFKPFTSYWIGVSEFDYVLGCKFFLFKKNKAQVIANGVLGSGLFDNSPVESEGKLNVVFVGRSSYQKNCESAINVIKNTDSSISLTMYTSGKTVDKLRDYIDSSSAKGRIRLIVDEPNAASLLHNYSVMLVTSRYEGMPLSVLEAMSSGLAIVSTDVCGMNELVVNDSNGYLLPENAEIAMANRLNELSSNPEKLKEMQLKSRERFLEKFTQEKMLSSISLLYKKLIL